MNPAPDVAMLHSPTTELPTPLAGPGETSPNILATYFLPYQARLIETIIQRLARFMLYEKSSRVGITLAVAFAVAWCCTKRIWAPIWWYQANDDLTARQFIEKVGDFAKLLNVAYKPLGEQVVDEKNGIKAHVAEFATGHKVYALSSNPMALYGKGGNVILDEFALHQQARELWIAAQRAKMWGGCILVFSQHYHVNTEFNQLCKKAEAVKQGRLKAGKDFPKGAYWRTTVVDAIREGFFDKLKGLGATEAETPEEFLNQLRSECATENDFNRIYMCVPEEEAASYLSRALIEACQDAACPVNPPWFGSLLAIAEKQYLDFKRAKVDPDPHCMELRRVIDPAVNPELKTLKHREDPLLISPLSAAQGGETLLFGGRDIGRKRDLTVDWLLAQTESGRLRTVAVLEMEKMPFFIQEKILFALLHLRGMRRYCLDSTGLGAQMAEDATNRFGPATVEPVEFTLAIKEALAGLVLRHHEDRSVSTPLVQSIADSIFSVKKYASATKHFRFDAERTDATGHADHFWALALALNAAEKPAVGMPQFVSTQVKRGWVMAAAY